MRDTEREREEQRHRQREKQPPCREPYVGLDPGTPGSCPGLKAEGGAKPLSPPGIPGGRFYVSQHHLGRPGGAGGHSPASSTLAYCVVCAELPDTTPRTPAGAL